jgi:hypothetical protein
MLCRAPLFALLVVASATSAAAAEPFSHADWTAVLARFVDERGLVDYAGLALDRTTLDRYLAALARTSPDTRPELFPTRAHELAYWLNAYNAMVFRGVLARGPERESVWGDGLFGLGFFTRRDLVLGGATTSLKSLEDDVVRARFRDPRVHAALNCASRGCPRLPRRAFAGATLDAELDAAMREFVGEERNVALDPGTRTVTLSKVFDWFAADFRDFERRQGSSRPSVVDYVNRYRPPGARIPAGWSVRFALYDERINARPADAADAP